MILGEVCMFIDECCEDLEVILAYIVSPSLGNSRDSDPVFSSSTA
ncbi:hypothetical protein N9Z10_05910 [Akkermansiaceae bacterium]|nr:hypothetical protein [Akkermansiaceae bacterium]MDA7540878.1 hypothetical protein [bacterium]MDA7526725.1 hypothetical protein [Akkermansiaceae bacterium]MDA7630654.1 hypothetical protein [Akkermansiaceae bacterium]MDA7646427.1 hypothetical protein [Akkermansiaceae bacterium]